MVLKQIIFHQINYFLRKVSLFVVLFFCLTDFLLYWSIFSTSLSDEYYLKFQPRYHFSSTFLLDSSDRTHAFLSLIYRESIKYGNLGLPFTSSGKCIPNKWTLQLKVIYWSGFFFNDCNNWLWYRCTIPTLLIMFNWRQIVLILSIFIIKQTCKRKCVNTVIRPRRLTTPICPNGKFIGSNYFTQIPHCRGGKGKKVCYLALYYTSQDTTNTDNNTISVLQFSSFALTSNTWEYCRWIKQNVPVLNVLF